MTEIKNIKNVTLAHPPTSRKIQNLLEQQFGILTVIGYLGRTGKNATHAWLCYCDCGCWTAIAANNLRSGNSTNCGCVNNARIGSARRSHGQSNKIPEYAIWKSIRGRCRNPNDPAYDNYGGRGITLCDEWDNFQIFLRDVGSRPSPHHSLDRINNDGDYEPANCKWATRTEQNNNKRSNHSITYQNRTQNLEQWVKELHISKSVFYKGILVGKTSAEALAYAVERKGKFTPAFLSIKNP